jgi:hypothetical protein
MDGLTPSQKGAAAEAAIASAALELGLTVLRPLCEGRRYDLVINVEPRLLRVQCKLARLRAGALSVGLKTDRCTPIGYVSTAYTAQEIDAVGAYSPDLRQCFLIPVVEVSDRRAIHLRSNRRGTIRSDVSSGLATSRCQRCSDYSESRGVDTLIAWPAKLRAEATLGL